MADTGWMYFSSASNDATSGNVAWTTLSSINTEDGTGPNVSLGSGQTSQYLLLSGFTLPAGVYNGALTGVEFRVRCECAFNIADLDIKLTKSGVRVGTSQALGTYWPTAFAIRTWGSSSNLWGGGISLADVVRSPSTVGVSVRVSKGPLGTTDVGYIDWAQIKFHYDPGAMLAAM